MGELVGEIAHQLNNPLVTLDVDPVLIRQPLFNLIHNAILAAPDKQVHVALILLEREGVPGIQLDVTDAGPGFDHENAAKLFKPFFTTRTSSTGLGLSVAQHIAMKSKILLVDDDPIWFELFWPVVLMNKA